MLQPSDPVPCVKLHWGGCSGAAAGTETTQQQLDQTPLAHGTPPSPPPFQQIHYFDLVLIS